jgi:DNA-binding CsgD family transcriptional regulator
MMDMRLLERTPFLAELDALMAEATAGRGHLVLVGGEAGVGKTALVQQFCRAAERTVRVAVGACDPLSTPRPLGPVLDMTEVLEGLEVTAQDGSRDQLFRTVLANLSASRATLLIFEDVHWADEATLDLLRFLGRRIGSSRGLLVATYRDDEVGAQHPLRVLLGDLATSSVVRRMALKPLSEAAVRQLAEDSPLDAAHLHQQTGGNPFFVSEILAAGGEAIPATVRDAVLARVARLSATSRAVLEAASVIGAHVETWLLTKVVGAEISAVEGCLDGGVLSVQGDGFAFRHELARQAVLGSISPHRQTVLHTLVLESLKTSSQDLARLAHHAEAAGDGAAVLEYAARAAQMAEQLKAYREAAAQYARMLRFAASLELAEQARLYEARGHTCASSEQVQEAINAYQSAFAIWHTLGNRLKEADLLLLLSGIHCGMRLEAESYAQQALKTLEHQAPGIELAWAHGCIASLRTETSDLDEAMAWSSSAIALSEQLGIVEPKIYALGSFYAAQLDMMGNKVEVRLQLEDVLRQSWSINPRLCAGIWGHLIEITVQHCQLDLARNYLSDGIAYVTKHGIDDWRYYIESWQAVCLFRQGRWDEAVELAYTLIRQLGISIRSRVQALIVLGRVRTLRGDPEVWNVLDEALVLADRTSEGTKELHRLVPTRIARAEAFWLSCRPGPALEQIRAVEALVLEKRHPWLLGEWSYWCWKLDDLEEPPEGLARPFALQIAGQPLEAARAWRELGCPYEAARALSESDDEAALREALAEFERLGAQPMIQWVSQRLRELGIKGIPRGPRPTTKTNPAGLTNRELEVLHLLAEGQRDKQIARGLQLSEKTVGHHVSAILGKLGIKSRAEAVFEARRLEILPN